MVDDYDYDDNDDIVVDRERRVQRVLEMRGQCGAEWLRSSIEIGVTIGYMRQGEGEVEGEGEGEGEKGDDAEDAVCNYPPVRG